MIKLRRKFEGEGVIIKPACAYLTSTLQEVSASTIVNKGNHPSHSLFSLFNANSTIMW